MTLVVLKHGGNWGVSAQIFNMKVSKFERHIIKFIAIVSPIMYQRLVVNVEGKFKIWTFEIQKISIRPLWNRCYISAVVSTSWFPSGGELYFSGKHKLYGYKVEVSVLPIGLAINETNHHSGSLFDLEILQRNRNFHKICHQKSALEKKSVTQEISQMISNIYGLF